MHSGSHKMDALIYNIVRHRVHAFNIKYFQTLLLQDAWLTFPSTDKITVFNTELSE